MSREIPIFFSTDDNYIPYLDVAVHSLIANASKDYSYRIIVLNTGLSTDNIAKVKLNECDGFAIDFVDISEISDMDAVILAVAHEEFKALGVAQIEQLFKKGATKVLLDLKGILDKKQFTDYLYWRL